MNSILANDYQDAADGLAQLVSNITLHYLSPLFAICVIWAAESSHNFERTLGAVLKLSEPTATAAECPNFYLIMTSPDMATNLADDIEVAVNAGCQAFIVSADVALTALSAYAAAIPASMHRYPQNHFVFVPTGGDDVSTYDILAHPVIADVPNILLIAAGQTDHDDIHYALHTSRFVGRNASAAAERVWLDTFQWQRTESNSRRTAAFRRNVHLFPDKLHNLEGRLVRLAMFNYKPYSVWVEVPAGQGNANAPGATAERTLSIDGTESLMMLAFCDRHNCTLEISLDEAGEWGEIWDNRTGNGVLGAVAARRADVGISALYEWHHEYQFLDFTTPIARTGITCIVPKPQLLSGLYLPAMPFSWQMWLGVFVSMIIGMVALIFVECFLYQRSVRRGVAVSAEDHVQPGEIAFQMCAMYLFQASNMMSKPGAEKFILTCVLLIGLMIGNAYSGGLASIMTVPQYEAPIDTPHQMAEQNLQWGATQDAWIFSILLATQPDIAKLVRLFQAQPTEALSKRTTSRDFGFSLERLPYGSYAIGEYIDDKAMDYLQLMHTDIYYEYSLAMTSKTWALKDELDTMINRVVQSGIQSMWEWQVVAKYSDSEVQMRVATSRAKPSLEGGPQPLSVDRLLGAFIIWLIGMAVAFLCFAVELVQKFCSINF